MRSEAQDRRQPFGVVQPMVTGDRFETVSSSPHPRTLLERLRERSADVRANASCEGQGGVDRRALDRNLLAVFRWLSEALGHLDVIRPVIAHRFSLAGLFTIASPRYDCGFVSYRRSLVAGFDLIARIDLYYRMAGVDPIRVDVHPGAAVATEDRLRGAQLDFHYRIEDDPALRTRRGVFVVTPAVMAAIRLVPDYDRGVVAATLRNVDRLEAVMLEFPSEGLGEGALEDLVRLILGEANAFLLRAPLAGVGAASAALGKRTTALSPTRYRTS